MRFRFGVREFLGYLNVLQLYNTALFSIRLHLKDSTQKINRQENKKYCSPEYPRIRFKIDEQSECEGCQLSEARRAKAP